MVHSPRVQRDLERGRRAVAKARAAGQSAMAAGLAQIGAAFDQAAVINGFKLRVERSLHLGPHHAAVRARFAGRVERLQGRSLDAAVVSVERWWRDERRAFAIASAFGRGSRLPLEVLGELRLILRIMRHKRMHAQFPLIVAALRDESVAEAAE